MSPTFNLFTLLTHGSHFCSSQLSWRSRMRLHHCSPLTNMYVLPELRCRQPSSIDIRVAERSGIHWNSPNLHLSPLTTGVFLVTAHLRNPYWSEARVHSMHVYYPMLVYHTLDPLAPARISQLVRLATYRYNAPSPPCTASSLYFASRTLYAVYMVCISPSASVRCQLCNINLPDRAYRRRRGKDAK